MKEDEKGQCGAADVVIAQSQGNSHLAERAAAERARGVWACVSDAPVVCRLSSADSVSVTFKAKAK